MTRVKIKERLRYSGFKKEIELSTETPERKVKGFRRYFEVDKFPTIGTKK